MPTVDGSFAFHANLNGHLDVSLTLAAEIGRRTREQLDRWAAHRSMINSAETLRIEQQRVREAMLEAIGGLPEPLAGPPPHYLPGHLRAGIEIQPLIFHSSPDVAVSATVYRPTDPVPDGGRGAVLITCGHTDLAKADPEYQRLARRLAASGLVVLIFDPIGQGERHSYLPDSDAPPAPPTVTPGTTEHTYAGVQAWWHGQSPVRYFLRDALAGLELLRSLPEVDPARVGVTGNSGGGYLCCLLMAVVPELAAAAPGTFVCGRGHYLDSGQRQDAEQILLGGTTNGLDHGDLLIGLSPAPVLVLAAEYDFFPYPGTLAVLDECNALLQRCGRDPIELTTTANGHHYDDRLATAATEFFAGHLGGRADDTDPGAPFAAVDLRTSRSGQLGADDPGQKMIFDELPHPPAASKGRSGDRTEDETALAWLNHVVCGPRLHLDRAGRRWFDPIRVFDDVQAQQGFWWTERGIIVAGVTTRSISAASRLLRIVLLDRGIPGLTAADARVVETDATTLFLDVRGTGTVLPHDREHKNPDDLSGSAYKLLSDLLWLGDGLQAGRAWDVLQTIRLAADGLLPEVAAEQFEIVAEPSHALTGTITALLDDRVQLILQQPADVESMISNRLWDDTDGRWQWVLPGWPAHFDTARVLDLLGDRLRIGPTHP